MSVKTKIVTKSINGIIVYVPKYRYLFFWLKINNRHFYTIEMAKNCIETFKEYYI